MSKKILYLLLLPFLIFAIYSCSESSIISKKEKQWLAQNDSISVAIYPYYPPFQFINEQNKFDGVFIDYLKLIEQKADFTFQRKVYDDWPKLMNDFKENKVHFILEIQDTKERRSNLKFYTPLFESQQVIVTRKDATFGNNIEELVNKTIVLPQDYAITENLQKLYPQYTFVTVKGEAECLQKLNAGQYDAYIGPIAISSYFIRTHKLNNLKINSGIDLYYKPGLAINKTNTVLDGIISKALNSITKKEKDAIFDSWFYTNVTPFYLKLKFWILVSSIMLLAFIIATSFNTYLKHKIKRRTEELIIAKDIAEESNLLKTNFIKNIPQEIRTPLNGIIGLSEFLKNDTLHSEERKKFSQMIIGNSKELLSIIDNILEISQLQTKRFTLKLSEINLQDIFQSLIAHYEIKAMKKNTSIHLENHLSDRENLILMDRPKLNKILNAVMENAVKYTTNGSVTISNKVKDNSLYIIINDTGVGILQKKIGKIKHSLTSEAKNLTSEYEGLGLGLIIAKKNADLIGGEISIDSEEKNGTMIQLKLPYNPVSKTKSNRTQAIDNQSYKSEKHIILIAEDVETNFLFLKTILAKMNGYDFTIYRAKNGKEAITICEENETIDLVLMDIKMPIMNGYDATKYIKKIRPNLPIIAQTAYSIEEDVQKALDAGCDDFVSKPVDKKLFIAMITKHFDVFKNRSKTSNFK